jgi:hypothetical protein
VDVPRAVRRGLIAAQRVELLLPVMAKLPEFDVTRVVKLRTYGLAVLHTHALVVDDGKDKPSLPVLIAEAGPLREDMLRSAELLVHFGVVPAERVAKIRSGRGHADTAEDLHALGRLFHELWPRVKGRVWVTTEMIERAATLSTELQGALAEHEVEKNPLTKHASPRHVRAQAFTLFVRAYEECRRGVAFLRWYEGDARGVVPSLYPRSPRRPGEAAEDDAAHGLLDPSSVIDSEPTPEPRPTPVAETSSEALVAHA